MDNLGIKFCRLIQICIFLAAVSYMKGASINFKNITCETWDKTWTSVDYCYVKRVDHLTNSVSVRYNLFKPIKNNIFFNFRWMIQNNGWQPFLYAIDLDMCRFWKSRYNGLAKMMYRLVESYTNLNHSCPYLNEKYLSVDNMRNTDISKSLPNLPLINGHYAIFNKWSWDNMTHMDVKLYLEITSV